MGAVQLQGDISKDNIRWATDANRPNMYTPWGRVTWNRPNQPYTPGKPYDWHPSRDGHEWPSSNPPNTIPPGPNGQMPPTYTDDKMRIALPGQQSAGSPTFPAAQGPGGVASRGLPSGIDGLPHYGDTLPVPGKGPAPSTAPDGNYRPPAGSWTDTLPSGGGNTGGVTGGGTSGGSTPNTQGGGAIQGGLDYEMFMELNPALQRQFDLQNQVGIGRSEMANDLLGQTRRELGREMNWGGLPQVGSGMDARQRAEDAIMSRASSRLDPMWNQREEQMKTQLLNQGLDPSSEAYRRSMDDFSRQRNDAYQGAIDQSIATGGAEMSRQFGQDSTARQQQIAEEMQRQGWSLNKINSALSGQQVGMPSFPSFGQAGTPGTGDYLGAAQAAGQFGSDLFNTDQMFKSQLFGSGASIFKGLLGGG